MDLLPQNKWINCSLQYMKAVKTAVISDNGNIVKIYNHLQQFSRNINENIDHFHKDTSTAFKKADMEFDYLLTQEHRISYITNKILRFQIWQAELLQLNDVIAHCRGKLIPISMIKPEMLIERLEDLSKEAMQHQHELAIPILKFGDYYNVKIASCKFTEKRILITLNIPIRKATRNYELNEFRNVPFKFNNSICLLDHAPAYVASSPPTFTSIAGTDLNEYSPEDGLCLVPQFNTDPLLSSICAEKVAEGATVTELKSSCAFTCKKIRTDGPIITQLDHRHFVITNGPEGMKLTCNAKSSVTTKFLEPPMSGALEIFLPCKCKITIPYHRPIEPTFPCPSDTLHEPVIHIIIPSEWSKLDTTVYSIKEKPNKFTTFSQIGECLNSSWNLDTEVFNISGIDDLLKLKAPHLLHKSTVTNSMWLFYLWNGINSVLIFILGKCLVPALSKSKCTIQIR